MKNMAIQALSSSNSSTTNGETLDCSNIFSVSAQAVSTGTPTGSFKLQASNDPAASLPVDSNGKPVPQNWTDIASATGSISAAGSVLIAKIDICYQWIRAVFISSGAGVQTISPIADTGVKEVSNISTVADVAGSLNSTYFTFYTALDAVKYYVWYDDGAGVDPAIPGATGIQVIYADGDSANTIAGNTRTAVTGSGAAVAVTGATNHVILTNNLMGNSTNASNGAASPGFGYVITQGVSSNLNSKYFLLSDANDAHLYYVWINVNSQGVDPAIAGRTGVPIAVAAGASAGTIGTAIASAVAALNATNSFTTSGTTTVTITNKVTGPYTPMADGTTGTGFTFAQTAGSGTTAVNLKSLGY